MQFWIKSWSKNEEVHWETCLENTVAWQLEIEGNCLTKHRLVGDAQNAACRATGFCFSERQYL